MDAKELVPVVQSTYAMEDALVAIDASKAGHITGKLALHGFGRSEHGERARTLALARLEFDGSKIDDDRRQDGRRTLCERRISNGSELPSSDSSSNVLILKKTPLDNTV